MPKILYIWQKNFPWDVRAAKICESLSEKGYDVYILARWSPGQKEIEEYDGYKIIFAGYGLPWKMSAPFPFNPVWKKAVDKHIKNLMPDLLIVRDLYLASISADAAVRNNIPVINDMAENYPAAMRAWKKYNSNLLLKKAVHDLKIPDKMEKKAVSQMDGIVVVCEEQIDRLHKSYNFPKERICVVRNTPPLKALREAGKKNTDDHLWFGHHGYLSAEKDISLFVRGFLDAADEEPNIRLLIAGGGECMQDIKNIVSQSMNKDKVIITGAYDFSETERIISKIDIGVLPYPVNDFNNYTLHNKMFDYFAAGIPVLVSRIVPSERVIGETGAGFAADCSELQSIKEAVLDTASKNLSEYAENAYKAHENKFNWENDFSGFMDFVSRYI